MVDTFPQELPYSAIIKNKIQAVKRIPASSSLLTDPKYTVQNSDGVEQDLPFLFNRQQNLSVITTESQRNSSLVAAPIFIGAIPGYKKS